MAIDELKKPKRNSSEKHRVGSPIQSINISTENPNITDKEVFGEYAVQKYQSGKIEVLIDGEVQPMAKEHLREIASKIGVGLFYKDDKEKNTRLLGQHIIKKLAEVNRQVERR